MSMFLLLGATGLLCAAAIKTRYLKNRNSLTEAYGCDAKGRCDMMKVIDSPDKTDAANQLLLIFHKIRPVYDAMRKRPGFVDRGPLVLKDIMESDGFATADEKTTYTYDKKSLHVCLRDENSNLYASPHFRDSSARLNHILYVVLHEITHKLTKSWEHTPEFWRNFSLVVKEAERQNVYVPEDFSLTSWVHCGKKIVNRGGF